ncbi:hypothetical protein BKA56DRAFT_146656 [Ilyonectria sp. MPI-CAGE-AT-0026]|nr:hypothetical protein BKA56DRAFT_146656 [Ilyonectria sp. MPI-CAGE-AT-0026]
MGALLGPWASSGSWAALSTGFSECPESPVACLPSVHPQRFFFVAGGRVNVGVCVVKKKLHNRLLCSHHSHSLLSYLVTVSQASLGLSCHEGHAYERQRQTGRGRDRLKARLAPILRLLIPNALTSLRAVLVIPHLPSPSSPTHGVHQITILAAGPHRNQNLLEARYRPSPAPDSPPPLLLWSLSLQLFTPSTASSPHSSTPLLFAHPPGFPPLFLSTTQSQLAWVRVGI